MVKAVKDLRELLKSTHQELVKAVKAVDSWCKLSKLTLVVLSILWSLFYTVLEGRYHELGRHLCQPESHH